MKLISLSIENFGNLSNFRYDFSDGVNTLYRENGFGKSTLAAFIKAMFYGLSDSRRISILENERKRYAPWQGGIYGGSLDYEADGKRYRVERTFSVKPGEDTYALYLADTGKLLSNEPTELGRTLFGIDADGFERTVFLSERNLSGKNDNKSVAEKLSNLVGTTGDVGALDGALDRLEEMRRYYFKKGGSGAIAENEERIRALQTRLDEIAVAERQSEEARKLYAEKCKESEAQKQELDRLRGEERALSQKANKRQLASQYRNRIAERDGEAKTLERLTDFFREKRPTDEEIDAVSAKLAEAEHLERRASENAKPFDAHLSLYRNTSPEVIARMTALCEEVESKRRELRDREAVGAPKARLNALAVLIVGVLLAIAGFALGFTVSYAFLSLSCIAILCFIFSFTLQNGLKKQTDAWNRALDELKREKSEKEAALTEFLTRFGEEYEDPVSAAREVKIKFDTYRTVITSDDEREREREAAIARAKLLQSEGRDFLSHFPTQTENPLSEIRRMKNQLEVTEQNLRRDDDAIARFLAENGVGAAELLAEDLSAEPENPITKQRVEAEAEFMRAEREATRLHTQYESLLASLENADALEEEKRELEEKINLDRKHLETVRKTKAYLELAKENLNAMYLDGTKHRFLEYVRTIGADDGEFAMDTDFAVSRIDRGSIRSVDAYSMGKRDLFALAARLALVDSLYENEQPILILDDPFAHMDDSVLKHAKAALKALSKKHQILYLTCTAERNL